MADRARLSGLETKTQDNGAAKDVPANDPVPTTFKKDILPFLTKHCYECHGNGKKKAGLALDKYKDEEAIWNSREIWENAVHMIQTAEMPPKEKPRPTQDEIAAVAKAIDAIFNTYDRNAKPNVGRVTIRRLNRTEYNNTIRDMVGVDFKPADDFPADDVGYGFDNIGDVLTVSPFLLEKYLSAAESIIDQVVFVADAPKPSRNKLGGIRASRGAGSQLDLKKGAKGMPFSLFGKGDISAISNFEAGDYTIRAEVSGQQSGDEPVRGVLKVDQKELKAFELKTDKISIIEAKISLAAGSNRVAVSFLNPFTDEASKKLRLLQLKSIEMDGPYNAPPPTRSDAYKQVMAHTDGLAPREAAREIIARFATKAYRRPARSEEVEACLALYDAVAKKGRRFEECVRPSLYRVMVSPHFLFRVEQDPPKAPPGTPYLLGEYELASRLSYFLWNSMPDAELFALAGKGELRKNLTSQILRMTKDAKSKSFLEDFSEQWLTLRKLELSSPDPKLYPKFDNTLRQAMIRESQMFFDALVRENRSILELLDADFTFVNGPLAKHYGIAGVQGKEFVRVKTPPGRGGILTQASILTLSSNATRTSPVRRGKFVLEQVLNSPPPPPPDDVPELEDQKELKGTLRQIMEQHRKNPVCASCHRRMDPLGFAFENFDAVGVWREKDGDAPVDASGELPDGRKFNGPDGLKKLLKENNSLFVRCLSEKMLTYALGRGLERYDRRAVDKIVEAVAKDDYRFSSLISEIIKSDPFQMRMTGEAK